MFSKGLFDTDPSAIDRSVFFPRPLHFCAWVRGVLGLQSRLKALPPFLLLFACSSAPGKVTRGKLFDILQFLDCEIQQNHIQNHVDLLRVENLLMVVSGIAYTKKSWLTLKIRKAQSDEKRPSLPFPSSLGKLDEHTHVCLHCL